MFLQSCRSAMGIVVMAGVLTLSMQAGEGKIRATVELDIPYVDGGGHDQQLDLYTPDAPNFPTIVFVHEGGMTSGDRKDSPYAEMAKVFQNMGIACALVNYRLAPDHKWPSQPNDVVSAFDWVKRNIGRYGGDSKRIFLFGHSSGCYLVSMVGTDQKYLQVKGYSQKDIAGVIAMGCRLNDHVFVTDEPPECYECSWVPAQYLDKFMRRELAFVSLKQRNDAVPARHVTRDLPPTLVLIAEEERFFPPILRDAAEFVGRALVAKAKADISILDDRRHMTAIQNMVRSDDPAVVRIVEFVQGK